jgi:hypothetical protein
VPDINEGLEIGGEPVVSYEEGDVNTQGGFEAGLQRAVSGETATPEEETEEAAPEEEEDTEAPTEEAAPTEPTPEDWKALYEEERSRANRQGTELGDLRAQVAEMRASLSAPTPSPGPINAEAMLDEYGGEETINWVIDNAPEQIESVARAWALSGDPEGAVFYADYRAEQARLESAPQAAPEQDPTLAQVSTERKLADVFREAREANPADFASYEQGLATALQSAETPDEIKLMLMSGNVDHMRAGFRHLTPYARLAVLGTGAKPAPAEAPQEDPGQEEARRDAARRTAIVTGSQRLQAAGTQTEAGELTSEERIARFKEMFEAEPDTSIAAGLTINGQPVLPQRPRRSG